MIFAARDGHLPVVEYLAEIGADMETRDNNVNEQLNINLSFVTLV